jgi:hypothetical protein
MCLLYVFISIERECEGEVAAAKIGRGLRRKDKKREKERPGKGTVLSF